MTSRIGVIEERPWGNETLHKDPTECLRFWKSLQQLIGAQGAHRYMDPAYEMENPEPFKEQVKLITNKAIAHGLDPANYPPLTETEATLLPILQNRIRDAEEEATRVRTALGPIKSFIDDHVDLSLASEIREFSLATDKTLPYMVSGMTNTILSSCLSNAYNTNKQLRGRFNMGKAATINDVISVLDNMEIITSWLELHHNTITNMVDREATARAEAIDPRAPDVMMTCPPVPTDQELITVFTNCLDISCTSTAPIITLVSLYQNEGWNSLKSRIRTEANKWIVRTRGEQPSKKPRIDEGKGSSSDQRNIAAAASSTSSQQPSAIDRPITFQDMYNFQAAILGGTQRPQPLQPPTGARTSDAGVASFQPGQVRPFVRNNQPCRQEWNEEKKVCAWKIVTGYDCKFLHWQIGECDPPGTELPTRSQTPPPPSSPGKLPNTPGGYISN